MSIAVDGVLTDIPLLDLPVYNGMGSWKLSAETAAIVIGTDVVALKGKDTPKDFSIDYDWLLDQMKQYPEQHEYKMQKLSPITLGKSFNFNRPDDLGKVDQSERSVIIGYDKKRCYIPEPENGNDILQNKYKSVSWDISFLR